MIRQHLRRAEAKHFHWRGKETTRLEQFSDAVFAFAVTLLVVSLEVPKDVHELFGALRGFLAFGVCFVMLVLVWVYHCHFFRRYGLEDGWTMFLNSLLLFFVLFYVYPLKFLAVTMFGNPIGGRDLRILFIIYGSGFAAVFLTFALLYWHAWRKRGELALTEIEALRTRNVLINHLVMAIIGLCSLLLALVLPEHHVGWAGYFYFVISIYLTIAGLTFRRHERRITEGATTSAAN